MEQQSFHAIGLMSGTSLDGLDICYAKFIRNVSKWDFQILNCETVPYSSDWEHKLRNAIHLPSEELLKLNLDYGFLLGELTQNFINEYHISELDLIASHGHTVFHQPENRFTLQIGDGRAIKSKTNKTVIYDFRSQDVIFGGNGAPLVPIGDELLFSGFDACLNLGGFSNISMKRDGKRIAFDICPVNTILNDYAQQLGEKYDNNGELARAGNVITPLLNQLNQLPFYQQSAPKSLGIEWVNMEIIPMVNEYRPLDILATLSEHAATQIAAVLNKHDIQNVLVTGGGAYNRFLIERIQSLSNSDISIPDRKIVDYKEALIFSFIGILRSLNHNNVLSSATGSSQDHSSGLIC